MDNLSKSSDSKKEQEQIEKRIISILQNQQNTLEQLDDHLSHLKQRYGELDEEIKMKQVELERSEKRLESLNNAKPAHLIELRQLEAELSHYYRIYVEKIRNHDYLSAQLDKYHRIVYNFFIFRRMKIKKKEIEFLRTFKIKLGCLMRKILMMKMRN